MLQYIFPFTKNYPNVSSASVFSITFKKQINMIQFRVCSIVIKIMVTSIAIVTIIIPNIIAGLVAYIVFSFFNQFVFLTILICLAG